MNMSAKKCTKRRIRLCSVLGCINQAKQNGVCCRHGAIITRPICTAEGCIKNAQRGGLCRQHKAFDLDSCAHEGCRLYSKKGQHYCEMHDVVSQEQKKKEAMIDEFIASRSVESTTADAASSYSTKKRKFTALVATHDNRSVPAAMKTVALAGNRRVALPNKSVLSEFWAPEERSPACQDAQLPIGQAESKGGAPQHKRCKATGCTKYMVGKHITDGYCLTCFREERNGKTKISYTAIHNGAPPNKRLKASDCTMYKEGKHQTRKHEAGASDIICNFSVQSDKAQQTTGTQYSSKMQQTTTQFSPKIGAPSEKRCKGSGCVKYHQCDGYCLTCFSRSKYAVGVFPNANRYNAGGNLPVSLIEEVKTAGAPLHKRCKAPDCTKYMAGKHVTDGYCLTCFRERTSVRTEQCYTKNRHDGAPSGGGYCATETSTSHVTSYQTADKRKQTLDMIQHRQDLLELIKHCRTVAEQRLSEMLSAVGELNDRGATFDEEAKEEFMSREIDRLQQETKLTEETQLLSKTRGLVADYRHGNVFPDTLDTEDHSTGDDGVLDSDVDSLSLESNEEYDLEYMTEEDDDFLPGNKRRQPNNRKNGIAWDQLFQELVEYKALNGHLRVKERKGGALGNFVRKIREHKKKIDKGVYTGALLTQSRVNQLNDLGFIWRQRQTQGDSFDERMEELRAYKDKHGHCDIPRVLENNMKLSRWCHMIKQSYKLIRKGEKPLKKLNEDQLKQLADIGFRLKVEERKKVVQKAFEQRIEDLKEHQRIHGHIKVTEKTDLLLARWCAEIRGKRRYPGRINSIKLTEEQIAKLDILGFDWNPTYSKTSDRIQELKAFNEMHGHMPTYTTNQSLAQFCNEVRHSRRHPDRAKSRRLSDEDVAELESFGFEWNPCVREKSTVRAKSTSSDRIHEPKFMSSINLAAFYAGHSQR